MSKRKHPGGDARDGGGGGASKRKFARGGSGNSFIHGPGIFVSCTRGKEHRAATELIDFLEEIVSRNYADVVLEDGAAAAGEDDGALAKQASVKLADRELDEDDMDALLNGEVSVPSNDTPAGKEDADSKQEEVAAVAEAEAEAEAAEKVKAPADENDVEAQIRAELAELRQQSSSSRGNAGGGGREEGKGKRAGRQRDKGRFKIVDTGIECFRFVSVARPLDPLALVHHLLADVERTGSARSRFIQRLTPVSSTHIATEDQLLDVAAKELPLHFGPRGKDGEAEGEGEGEGASEGKTFKVEVRTRNHQTLRRDDIIRSVAGVVSDSCGTQHRANLTSPELVIVVEVFKSIFGIGVLKDYERFRRYNVVELAKKVNDEDPSATLTSRTAASGGGGGNGEDKNEGQPVVAQDEKE